MINVYLEEDESSGIRRWVLIDLMKTITFTEVQNELRARVYWSKMGKFR